MTKKRKNGKASIIKFTDGVLEKAVDLVLVSVLYSFEFTSSGYNKRWTAEVRTDEAFSELNYQSIKRAARYLKQEGLVKTTKGKSANPELTQRGKRKVDQIIPKYDIERTWEGRLFLITYDIPESKKARRNMLRNELRKFGSIPLQKSVWISAYNPKKVINKLVNEYKLDGLILISTLGPESSVGEYKVGDIAKKVYRLDKLNKKYKKFIVEAGIGKTPKHRIVFKYLSILNEDPQLPFDLLPEEWLGENAYQVFKRITR